MEKFTLTSLKNYDGKDGRKAYIAYKGKVYDVTESKMWKNGSHVRKHFAGNDLTVEMSAAPHGDDLLSKFPLVGLLEEEPKEVLSPEEEKFERLQKWYYAFHPHPIMVHFAIALLPFTILMEFLYLFTKNSNFFYAGYYSLICGFIGVIIALLTGVISWYINYRLKVNKLIKHKLVGTAILTLMCIVELYLGYQIINGFDKYSLIYTALVAVNIIPLGLIAFNGGQLTWPSSK